MSTIDSTLPPLHPSFPRPTTPISESSRVTSLIQTLHLQTNIEGGYFAETDRDPLLIPNPFLSSASSSPQLRTAHPRDPSDLTRNASTTIFYLLTPGQPLGAWHRNKGRTVHTLHWGRGRYVIIHADEVEGEGVQGREGRKARVETFVVGRDVEKGERLQWIVEGGKYKASFLLPDGDGEGVGGGSEGGLLISETVVPGFEYSDHDFLLPERLKELVTPEQAEELAWMLRSGPPPEEHELEYKNK